MPGNFSTQSPLLRRLRRATVAALAAGLLAGSLAPSQPQLAEKARRPPEFSLPNPRVKGRISLEEALAKRRSIRQFSPQGLSMADCGQLMWAAQGITDGVRGLRTAPSAGATYPLEIYLVGPDGVFRYIPQGHRLNRLSNEDLRRTLSVAAVGQTCVSDAALDIVIATVLSRTQGKYRDRAERYVLMEAGHAAQNVLLQATAMGLGAVPVGAFDDQQVKQVLGLPNDEQPQYIISVGHPR